MKWEPTLGPLFLVAFPQNAAWGNETLIMEGLSKAGAVSLSAHSPDVSIHSSSMKSNNTDALILVYENRREITVTAKGFHPFPCLDPCMSCGSRFTRWYSRTAAFELILANGISFVFSARFLRGWEWGRCNYAHAGFIKRVKGYIISWKGSQETQRGLSASGPPWELNTRPWRVTISRTCHSWHPLWHLRASMWSARIKGDAEHRAPPRTRLRLCSSA